ncbi:MAG: T9SS type A sorting domain-containing protein [candidate division WOR-3 bacterium]|nr:T9SS type A sorting domain-containing protein [candidate division WOR-3 bacterium]
MSRLKTIPLTFKNRKKIFLRSDLIVMSYMLKKIYYLLFLLPLIHSSIAFSAWSPLSGPFGSGNIRAIAISQSNPQTLYLADWESGVFKSTDEGETWAAKRNGLTDWRGQGIAIDPTDENIVYLNTYWQGLFRSTDGGDSWVLCLPGTHPAVTAHPTEPNIVYTVQGSNFLKSTDQGITWDSLGSLNLNGEVFSIAIAQANPQIIYVAAGWNGGMPSGVAKSTDGGLTWAHLTNGIPDYGAGDVKIDPQDTNTVFVAASPGVYRTFNGGADWTQVLARTNNQFRSVGIDLDSSNIIYAGTCAWGLPNSNLSEGLFKSTDQGTTWFEANNGLLDNNIQCIAINPLNPSILYCGIYNCNQGGSIGVYKSTDRGITWFSSNSGITQSIWTLAVLPDNSQTIWAGTYGGGAYKSEDDGLTWQQKNNGITDQRVQGLAIDPSEPNQIYTATTSYQGSGGIFKTTNGGENWTKVWDSAACSRIAIDISRPSRIWAGAQYPGYILRSTDYGLNWQIMFNTGNGEMIRSICVDPADSQIVYVGDYSSLYKSENGGSSWTDITPPVNGEFNSIVVDPIVHEVVYVGVADWGDSLDSGVWKSDDGGLTWTRICTIRKVGPLVMAPQDNQTLYLGSYWHGVFVTKDGGNTWNEWNAGFEQTSLSIICLGLRDSIKAYAGLYVDGLFMRPISVGIEKTSDRLMIEHSNRVIQCSPNPFILSTNIRFQLNLKSKVSIKIYNRNGQLVKTLVNGLIDPAIYEVNWNGQDGLGKKVPAGIYFVRFEQANYQEIVKVILSR